MSKKTVSRPAAVAAALPDSLKIRPEAFSVSWNTGSQDSSSPEWQWIKPPVTNQTLPAFTQPGGMAIRCRAAGRRRKLAGRRQVVETCPPYGQAGTRGGLG